MHKSKLDEFYAKNFTDLVRWCNWVPGHWSREDVVQEAYIRALRGWESAPSLTNLPYWFKTIIMRTRYDYIEKEKHREKLLKDRLSGEVTKTYEEPANDFHVIFKEEVDKLGKLRSTCLTLYFIYGYTCPEVARATGRKMGTVSMGIYHFRKYMRAKYGSEFSSYLRC